jgi:thiamine-monophosphate kinase
LADEVDAPAPAAIAMARSKVGDEHDLAHLDARAFDAGGPTLRAVGERVLLDALVRQSHRSDGPEMIVASGDDAAVLGTPLGQALVVTQDALVEGVDFLKRWITPYRLGQKALAVSLSDLAAMGSTPAFCLLTICARPSVAALDVLAMAAGLGDAAAAFGCAVAGGDVSAIDGPLVLDVVAGGYVARDRILRRDAGRPGDLLLVTGILGRAAAGLAVLQGQLPASGAHPAWVEAQLNPRPRLAEGGWLAARGVRCAGDVSDGLWVDAERTATASNCGAELWWERLPVDPELRQLPDQEGQALALAGGEDFELLVAAPPELAERLVRDWPSEATPLSVVGRLVPGRGVRLITGPDGDILSDPVARSLHFG